MLGGKELTSSPPDQQIPNTILMTFISRERTDKGEEIFIICIEKDAGRGGGDQLPTRSTTTELDVNQPILKTSTSREKTQKVKKSSFSGEDSMLGGEEVTNSPPDKIPNMTDQQILMTSISRERTQKVKKFIIWRGEDIGREGGNEFPTRSTTTERDIKPTYINGNPHP